MLLLLVLFLPALGAVLIALFKHLPPRAVKLTAAAFTLLPLVFAISMFISFDNFDVNEAGLRLVTQESWFCSRRPSFAPKQLLLASKAQNMGGPADRHF